MQHPPIIFEWVLSHQGTVQNEFVDRTAKTCFLIPNLPVYLQDVTIEVKQYLNEQLRKIGKTQLQQINSKQLNHHSWIGHQYINLVVAILCRLRISYLLQKSEVPMCQVCSSSIRIQHILINCQQYFNIHSNLQLPNPFFNFLSNNKTNTSKLLSFLKCINFTSQI